MIDSKRITYKLLIGMISCLAVFLFIFSLGTVNAASSLPQDSFTAQILVGDKAVSRDVNNVVILKSNTYSADQFWEFIPIGNGQYKILNKGVQKALDVNNAADKNGANIQVYDDNGSSAQKWKLNLESDGSYTLQPACSNSKVMNVENGNGATNGTNVELYQKNNSSAQKFTIKIGTQTTYSSSINPSLQVQAHVQDKGTLNAVNGGQVAGTIGQNLRLEGISLKTNQAQLGISYSAHVQDVGWQSAKKDGELAGTTGQSKRLEALKINLTGADASKYDVYYTAYVQDYGWLNWAKNGEISGTVGLSKRIEGIEVVVLNKGATVPRPLGKVTKSSYNASDLQNPHIQYKVHQQNAGWSKKVQDGIIAGTTGKSLRLEALKVNLTADNLKNTTTSVTYRTHVQNKGWTSWSNNNQTSGTTGQSKRLEAVQIKLNNSISEQYDIYYAVHVQNYGWLGWAKNSETAGTQGYGLRTEAIAIKLIPKGESAPQQLGKISAAELTSDYFKKNYTISYRSHVQKIGWQSWLSADQTSGTTGQSLQMEALQIKLSDTVLGDSSILYRAYVQDKGTETDWTDSRKSDAYSGTTGQGKRIEAVQIKLQGNASSTMNVWYRVHSENYGWLGWTKNGEWAGTSNGGLRAEAVQICVLPKTAAAPGSTDQPYVSLSTVKTGSLGVDVSEWQGYISADNWRKAKNAGYSFAMLRIAWGHAGNGAMDKQFNNNYANATSAGMPFGVYVYSYADTEEEARQEADYAISLLDGRSLKMPICIDLEDDRISYLSKTQQSKNAIAFCEEVKKAGYTPMIYANQNWLNNHLDYSMIKNYKIWYAQYPYSWSSYSKPSYNNHIDIWQYSDRGNVPGLSGSIDMNKAYSNF